MVVTDPRLEDLRLISEAKFQAQYAGIQDILAEEQRIRRAIFDLDEQHALARDVHRAEIGGHLSFGGDVLWQGWVARSRRALQIQLAQVLVRKAEKLKAISRAHGRKLASETLCKSSHDIDMKKTRLKQNEQEQSLFLLDEAMGRGMID